MSSGLVHDMFKMSVLDEHIFMDPVSGFTIEEETVLRHRIPVLFGSKEAGEWINGLGITFNVAAGISIIFYLIIAIVLALALR